VRRPTLALTAVFIHGTNEYVGSIEELPQIHSHGRTLDEARSMLQRMIEVVFEEERRGCDELLADRDCVREHFYLALGGFPRRQGHMSAGAGSRVRASVRPVERS
jgi:predicted RNase H-like HicB family nuclease